MLFNAAIRRSILAPVLFLLLHTGYAQTKPAEVVSLFDGTSLKGWKLLDPKHRSLWSVKDSIIVCSNGDKKIEENSFLLTEKEYDNFEFRCLFRLSGDESTGLINSGIQYRSLVKEGNMVGYQADIGNGYWGDLYDEHRRGKLVGGDLSTLRHLLKADGWNSYIIRVKGNHHELYINGVKTCDYFEKDPSIPSTGVIALQIHGGGVAKVEYRNITLTRL